MIPNNSSQDRITPEDSKQAMAAAYGSGGYTLAQIASHYHVHYSTVRRRDP